MGVNEHGRPCVPRRQLDEARLMYREARGREKEAWETQKDGTVSSFKRWLRVRAEKDRAFDWMSAVWEESWAVMEDPYSTEGGR